MRLSMTMFLYVTYYNILVIRRKDKENNNMMQVFCRFFYKKIRTARIWELILDTNLIYLLMSQVFITL